MEAQAGTVIGKESTLIWSVASGDVDVSARGIIMGILNLTPDSFSDGGKYPTPEAAVERALQMAEEGAEILDLGGESTRPGSRPVSEEEELRRVLPVLQKLRPQTRCLISIDTSKASVARAALDAGAEILNDVTALRGDPRMIDVARASACGIVLMHMKGTPANMQDAPSYANVMEEVCSFLQERVAACEAAGIARERLCVDPGIGFGKTHDHNRILLKNLPELCKIGRPVLLGVSRKAFLGHATGEVIPGRRVWAGAAVTAFARRAGARIFRVHDVREHLHALRVAEAIHAHA